MMISEKFRVLFVLALFWLLTLILSGWFGYWIADTRWQKTYAEHIAADARVNEQATARALTKQREYRDNLNEVQEYAKSLEKTIADHKSDNDTANDGVQQQFDRIEALPQISADATIAERAAAATDRIVLAQLLSWTHQAYRRTAEQADENRKAGLICEAEYTALVKVCE